MTKEREPAELAKALGTWATKVRNLTLRDDLAAAARALEPAAVSAGLDIVGAFAAMRDGARVRRVGSMRWMVMEAGAVFVVSDWTPDRVATAGAGLRWRWELTQDDIAASYEEL